MNASTDLLDELLWEHVHHTAVFGSSVVSDPRDSPVRVDENERVAWLPRRHRPAHDAVRACYLVSRIGERERANAQGRVFLCPRLDGVGGDAEDLRSDGLEILAVLQ